MVRPRQVSDEEILEAARQCFIEHGPSVSISVIADKVGVTQPALSKRFGSKKNLLLEAMLPEAIPQWTLSLADGPDERPFAEQLLEIGERGTEYFADLLPRLMVLRNARLDPSEIISRYEVFPPVVSLRALSEWLERAYEKGMIREVDFTQAAMSLMGALHIREFLSHIGRHAVPEPDYDSYAIQLVDLFMRGLQVESEKK